MCAARKIERLTAGQEIPFGGDRVTVVGDELASSFRPGDHLVVVQETGELLRVPAEDHDLVAAAVGRADAAFRALAGCDDDQITAFFEAFAGRLADPATVEPILDANAADVDRAKAAGRSTTRLVMSEKMRRDMVDGLRGWRDASSRRDDLIRTIDRSTWSLDLRRAPVGVVGFVFEGRPNVFADACGVVRTGNTVVFRIGSDALGTARAIVSRALGPALAASGLPDGTIELVDSPSRAAGHALFSDRRLGLAVARGSGAAVAQLGAVARQAGVPVSLHGTGGAWVVAGRGAVADELTAAVRHSLDRKVCNTLNVCAVPAERASELVPAALAGLDAAAADRGVSARLHVVEGSERWVDAERFAARVMIERAEGSSEEPAASAVAVEDLGHEWEWESSPEITLVVVDSVDEAVELHNRYSPRFVASLISDAEAEHRAFYGAVEAPFVGNGFTRWVDGQYALDTPELGLSNWEGGRMLGRGAILSGDSVHTIRYDARIHDPQLHR